MKLVFTLLALTLLPFGVSALDAKTVCEQLQPVVSQLRTQLPQDVDYMTKLTGVQALFVSGNCLLNYNYVVSSAHLLQEMAAENQQSDDENLAFLQTEQGVSSMKSVFSELAVNAATTHFAVFNQVRGVKVTYSHSFDNTQIKPVVSVVIDNTQ